MANKFLPNNPLINKQRPMLNALALPLLFLAISALVFLPDLQAIHDLWLNNHSYDLGYPTLAMCLFFSYQAYANKPAYRWTPPFTLVLLGLLLAIALYVLANTTIMQAPRLLAYILIAIFFIAANVNSEQRLNQILAFSLLLYTIPAWGILTNLLQFLTVHATSFGLELTRIPAIIHGYYISLPGGTLEVEEGCSGLRYLVTTLLICHVFCLMNKPGIKGWILLFSAGTVMALIANWIRVYILSYVAYITDLQHPWIEDHNSLGWAVYSLIYIPLYFIAGPIMASAKSGSEFSFINASNYSDKKPALLTLLITLTALATPHVMSIVKAGSHIEDISFSYPENIGLCYLNPAQATTLPPHYVGFSQIFSASYDCTEGKLESHYLVYKKQVQGKELINIFNTLLDEKDWRSIRATQIDAPVSFALEVFANADGQYALTARTYIIDGQASISQQRIRSIMIKKGLLHDIPAALLSTVMLCKTNCSNEEAFMKNIFVSYTEQITGKK
jgi:exosortase